MLVSLMLLASASVSPPPAIAPSADDPPVRVWFNSSGDYAPGERAKVYAKVDQSGYLVVLRADPDGVVRVLFPLDPLSSQKITGNKKYELKGRGDREAFVADHGPGTVLAAVAAAPFQFDGFVQDGRWNVRALSQAVVRTDPESALFDLVKRMNPSGQPIQYDIATYVVDERFARGTYAYPDRGYGWFGYDPYWGPGPYGSDLWGRRGLYYGYRLGW
jgi:Domain of unknown function (DUF4384)